MTSFMMTVMPVAYSQSFGPLWHGPNLVNNESQQIPFCQNSLAKDLAKCFMMISMSVVHSLAFGSLWRITNSVHYGSFENWIYSIVDGNSSNHFFHDDFDVCSVFWKLWPLRTRTKTSHCKSRFVRNCMELTKPIVLSWFLYLKNIFSVLAL